MRRTEAKTDVDRRSERKAKDRKEKFLVRETGTKGYIERWLGEDRKRSRQSEEEIGRERKRERSDS